MKKILFATTALVATAGIASADIALTGMAEMGLFDNGNDDVQFFTDIDVTFTMTGEADNGLTFGASVDLDEGGAGSNAVANNSDDGGATMFVAFGSMRLTMGDTDGALDNVVPEMSLAGGSIADDETAHGAFLHHDGLGGGSLDGVGGLVVLDGSGAVNVFHPNPGQIARFDYTYNQFTFSLSAEQLRDGGDAFVDANANGVKDAGEDINDTVWGAGVRYSGDFNGTAITAGLGYQSVGDAVDVWALGVTAGFSNGLRVGANYSSVNPDGANNDTTAWNIGVGYTMNALAIGFNYGQVDPDGANNDTVGYGLAATYDLGGGLQARLGYGHTDPDGPNNDRDTWSLGLRMNF